MTKEDSTKKKVTKKSTKKISKEGVSGFVVEKGINESSSSVITRTTRPNVVIQSENIKDPCVCQLGIHKHMMIKFIFLIVMSIIILITFFLSIKTYSMVDELYRQII